MIKTRQSLSLFSALIAVLTVPAAAGAATVSATPAIPWPGASLRLDISGFQPRAKGIATLAGARPIGFGVGSSGRATVNVAVPSTARPGRHALRVQAGGRSISTVLSFARARRAPSTMVALSGGQRVVLDPARARPGDRFTVKAFGFSSRSTLEVRLGGAKVARQRPNAKGELTIGAAVPKIARGVRFVRVVSGPTVVGLRFVVLAPLAPPPPQQPPPAPPPPAAGDRTPPAVSVTAPASAAMLGAAPVSMVAEASDNVGVSGVQFRLDGKDLGVEDTSAPYSTTWDARATRSGRHTITAVARDAAGNTATSDPGVAVTVDSAPPTISISSPATDATVSGTAVELTATARDDVGVSGVQFRVDGKDLGTEDTSAPYSTTWNTATLSTGRHTITALARDGARNTTTSNPAVSVRVDNTGVRRIVAAGDIACSPDDPFFNGGLGLSGNCRQMATSDLFVGKGYSDVLTLGDAQYDCATAADFAGSFDPSWGRAKSIMHPATGNHEYKCDEAAGGYFGYFGGAAGDPTSGYYSFDIGGWHVVSLNTNNASATGCPWVSCAAGSPQEQWLRADLAAHRTACTIALWHHPLFSSKPAGVSTASRPFWEDLYAAGADIVLNGHVHNYERFRPQSPDGTLDLTRGIAQFVVGSGGVNLESTEDSLGSPPAANRGAATKTFGVLELTLRATSYEWKFLPEAGKSFNDSGSANCH
ncbi:MAG TPA: Ig-like domain-containing protein [Solirubrobacteraceae bacterium]